ncbi:MAG: InlB B-repeat-containing protein [Lachnospiraceae bacterium]|nr:InlB B-repeat-containing protein [Lachnospiraceae bacterium]
MMNRKMKRILAAVSAAAVIISSGAPSMPGAQVMASEEDTASVESAAVNSQDDAGASAGKTGAEAAAASQETESSASGAAENNSGAAKTDSRAAVNSGDAEESGSTDSSSASSESTSEYNEESADAYSTIDSSEESADAESAETEASDAEKSDVALHIHYEAGEGGSVTVSEEEAAVSSAEDEISLQGSEAVPSEGYEFAGWEKDDAEISNEAKFTPSIDLSQYFEGDTALTEEADLTYTAVFAVKEEKTKYPAIDFGKISFEDGSSVAVSAPEGAFPEGTKLSVTTVPAGDVLDEMKEASGEEALTEENVAAYEFNFYTEKDGVRSDGIEPLKDIRVSFENPAIEGSSPIDVYHVDEVSAPQKLETAETSEPSDDSAKTVIETAQFSTYVLMSAPAKKAVGPFWIGNNSDGTATYYSKLADAVAAAAAAGESTVHMSGAIDASEVSGAKVDNNITLDVAGDTTITGQGNSAGFTLASGSKIKTAEGATFTMTGFNTALTVDTGAIMTDGTYVFTDVNTGIRLNGAMRGSDRSKMHVKVEAKEKTAGIETTGNDLKFDHVSLIWNGGNQQDYAKCSLYAKNSDIIINNVWLDYKKDQPLNLYQCNVQISGKFSGSNNGFVLLVETNCSAEILESTVVVKTSRVNVTGELKIDNSIFTVMNSDSGGFNINYGGTLRINNSKLKADNVDGAFIVAGWRKESNLYIDGSSVIETAGSSSADSIGVNGSFVVTGGSYKVDENQLTQDDKLIPTNGEANGNEKLTLFHLANPSVSNISMINAKGTAYPYPVAVANEDGQKRVWGPKASVVFRLNNGNATFADGTTADKNGTTIRGTSLNFVKGNTDPGTPVSSDEFLGWYYKDSQGTEHPFTMDTAVTGNTEVYAKWNNISIVYHNGEGQSYIQSAQPGQTEMTVVGYPDIVNRNSDFAVQGKTFEYWTTAEDGTGTQYKKGDEISFENGETQVDLYAYYGVKQYSVRFSANGGTFSENSIFRNPNYFTIETDSYGGETAVLKKTATYGQTLHELTEELGLDYNQLKPDANAVRSGYKLSDKTYWSTSAFSDEVTVRFDDYKLWGFLPMSGENPTITDDVTWYLQWKPTVESSKLNGTITLPADIWHGGIENGSDSTRIQSVKPGDTVTLTAAVDVKEVKEKLEAIAGSFDVGSDEYSSIAITDPRCTFTAEFNIPEGFAVPDETAIQVNADGLGRCFDVTKTNISGRKITVTFELQSGIDDYQKLYDAVNSTGIKTALSESENDTITFKIAGLMVNGENKSDRDVLEIAGDVSGNFQAIATLDRNPDATSQGQSYYFAFTFKPSQTESGKDSNADSKNPISISYRLSKTKNLVLPGDMTTEGAADSRAVREVQPGSSLNYVGRLDVSSIKEQINTMEGSEREHQIRNVNSSFRAVITLGDGLSSSADKNSVTLTDNDLFEISDVTVEGSAVTVDMTLKDDYTSFTELKETVDSVSNILEVTVPVNVSASLPSAARIQSTGRLSGLFSAEVVDEKGQVLYEPSFTWTAKQAGEGTASVLGNGKDDAQSENDNDTIAYTVKTPSLYQLPGDISILLGNGAEDTESSQIYQTRVGDTLTLIGSLDVTSIVNQLNAISNEHNDPDGSNIHLINAEREPGVSFTFTLKAEIPEGISLSDVKAEAVSPTFGNNAFAIRKVEVDGRELTVHFGLADESIKTFDRLAAAVRQVGLMKIKISGLTVTAAGQQTVRVKSLTGSFLSCASNGSKELPFNFSWETVQSTAGGLLSNSLGEGKDAAQAADDNTTIAFTFDAAPLPIPVPVPVQPENRPVVPSGNSSNPTPIAVRRMTTINGSGSKPATEQLPTISGSDGDEPVDQTLPTIDGSIRTGDDQNMVLWFVFMAAAGAALVAFLARKRERNGKIEKQERETRSK